jgi:uncharacterized protein involved in exopolysaccharide biosynthesis
MNTTEAIEIQGLPARSTQGLREVFQNVKDWFFFMLRRWWIIALVVLLAGSAGVVYAWLEKPKFQSNLSFALEEGSGGGLSGALSLAAEFGLNLGGSKSIFAGDNILQIVGSRRVVENVLLTVDSTAPDGKVRTLAQYILDIKRDGKSFQGGKSMRSDTVNFPVNKLREHFSYLEDSVLFVIYQEEVLENLIAHRPDKKLGIFEIKYTSTDERFAKIFTERLMAETVDFYIELRSKKSKQTLEILENRVASLKGNVTGAISSRSAIQDANLNPAFAAAQAPLIQRQLDISAYGGAYSELFKNLELARYQFLQDVPLLQVIDNVNYPLKKIKKGRLMTGILFSMIAGIITVLILTLIYKLKAEEKSAYKVV